MTAKKAEQKNLPIRKYASNRIAAAFTLIAVFQGDPCSADEAIGEIDEALESLIDEDTLIESYELVMTKFEPVK